MKRRRTWFLMFAAVFVVCGVCGLWLQREKRQYARNRQLIAALGRDDTKAALALVNAGADPNTREIPMPAPTLKSMLSRLLHRAAPPINDSSTALHLACGEMSKLDEPVRENVRLVKAMLAHDARVNEVRAYKWTPLHLAVSYDRLPTVKLLIEYGANVNVRDVDGETLLMYATLSASAKMLRLLLTHGANVNMQNPKGETALYNAVQYGAENNTISELLAHGADPSLHAGDGNTPLSLAQNRNDEDLVRLLQRREK